jgi:hypothetical protein
MNSAGKGTGTVGYNVQTAVDTKNHMIVAHEVMNTGHDRSHLADHGPRRCVWNEQRYERRPKLARSCRAPR